MKTRTRQLAKPGVYGTKDNPQVVSEDDLKQIASTFHEIKKSPVSLNGHTPNPAAPRLGNVIAVRWDENTATLIGTIEEHDALAAAVEAGYYPDVSIGAKRRASDGSLYLHHLAYLGEEPPAIKDLLSSVSESLETTIAASDGEAEIIIPSIKTRLELSDTDLKESASVAGEENQKKEKKELEKELSAEAEKAQIEELASQLASARAETEKYKTQTAELAQKYPDEIQLSDSDPMVQTLIAQLRKEKTAGVLAAAAGKIPKAKMPLVEALAQAMPLGASIELSDAEGKKETVSSVDLLSGILNAIPSPVTSGSLDLSDSEDEHKPIDLKNIMRKI